MNRERFQSETGQSIDDNCCLFFGNTSPLFYTVNPRSGISLRQQEQLGAPSILKSFRDLPGCTRLSSSLSNLDSSANNRRAQYPLLPDINQKGNMGKSLQGHHSSKRFVRERYNPPFKVNAKIRHVYTQEVTTIEGQGQPNHMPQTIRACHRQTQTEAHLFPEAKLKPEVKEIEEEHKENAVDNDKIFKQKTFSTFEENESKNHVEINLKKVDASTSPIPSPYFPTSATSSESVSNPFSGCSQMTVYPPLNYVRKLEDLEKITGHIVIQRFFTRTDDAFGTWLEKQLGMTSKSVSVDTSEFENAKTAELQEDGDEEQCNEKDPSEETEAVVVEAEAEESNVPVETENSPTEVEVEEDESKVVTETESSPVEIEGEEVISGAVDNPAEGDLQEENSHQPEDTKTPNEVDCAFADPIKCECYVEKVEGGDEDDLVKEIEEQIIEPSELNPETITVTEINDPDGTNMEDEVETLVSSSAPREESEPQQNNEDIDEVVRCTLEAYLMAPTEFDDINDDNEPSPSNEEENLGTSSPSAIKSEVDSGRADSIQSQEKTTTEGLSEVEGNTSHDSVETVYELPMISSKTNSELILGEKLENGPRILQRSLSADSCIGTESSGDAKNQTTNASQSSNDTIEGLDPILAPKEMTELSLGSPASAPPVTSKLPLISATMKTVSLSRRLSSAKSHRSITPCSPRDAGIRVESRRTNKTDAEAEDADGESETESEITDHFQLPRKLHKHHTDGTDLELEEVEEDEGDDDDDRDAFDAMVANHLKYSRGLSTATSRRSKLNRGTQTTKSIEPSTTSGSMSPCSSSNSSFDVEIISKSKRVTTTSSSGGGGTHNEQHGLITPSNMTLAYHEGGRRRSYLPSSSSSLNLLNMKFSLGKDFESEVSIRMPANKSSTNNNMPSASMLLPGSGGTGGRTLMSSSSRTQHQHLYPNRGLSPSNPPTQQQNVFNHHHNFPNQVSHSPVASANSSIQPVIQEHSDLQSLWKDVRTKLDVQVDELVSTTQGQGEEHAAGLQVRGNGILPSEPLSSAGSTVVKLRRNEERIKRSLQRLKKILDD